jgi:citrate synthase
LQVFDVFRETSPSKISS